MSNYYKYSNNLHILELSKEEAINIIHGLTNLLNDGESCPSCKVNFYRNKEKNFIKKIIDPQITFTISNNK